MAVTPYPVACLTSLAQLEALRPEWAALVEAAEDATVFQSWDWVASWFEHFGAGRELLLFTVRDAGGRLVGAAPCSRARSAGGLLRLVHLLGRGNDATEYVQVLTTRADADAVAGALFDAWHRLSRSWDLLVLPSMPAAPCVGPLRRLAAARGYAVVAEDQARMLRPLPETWDAFYRSLRKSMKDNVNNYVNRLRRAGHREELVVVTDPDQLDGALDRFLELHRRRAEATLGRPHDDRFDTPRRQAFLRTAARRLFTAKQLWPCLLRVDGQTVAAQLCLVHKGRLYLHYSGFDPAWARYGVMTILSRRCIEWGIGQGCRELDLLLGLDQDKLRWGAEPRPVTNLTLASPRLRSRLALRLYLARRGISARRTRGGTRPRAATPLADAPATG